MESEPQNADPLLSVRDLRIAFGGREAVHGISFDVAARETLGLVGESGSGKSATSLAIMRLFGPGVDVTGSIRLGGRELLTLPEPEMRSLRGQRVAMIFQEPMTALNPSMPVGRQIAEAWLAHHPRTRRDEVQKRVLAAMREVALPEPERRVRDYPHQFSGGQRQRILIAMALINRPTLLIADEPTTALDVTVQKQILELLQQIRKEHGLAMLFISHDLAVVAQVAARVAVMQRGVIVEMSGSREIFTAPQHPYTQRLLAASPSMTTKRDEPLPV